MGLIQSVFNSVYQILKCISDTYWRSFLMELPPGPEGVPIVGHLFMVDSDAPYKTFTDWSERYGPVYCIKMGFVPVIIVSDPKIVTRTFNKIEFCGKSPLFVTSGIMDEQGIVNVEGARWEEQRRFTYKTLKHLGFNQVEVARLELEAKIVMELGRFMARIAKHMNNVFDIHEDLEMTISNVVCEVLFGRGFEENPEFLDQLKMSDEGSSLVKFSEPVNYFPLLRFLPPYRWRWLHLVHNKREHHQFLNGIVTSQRAAYERDPTLPVDSFVGAYVKELIERENSGATNHFFSESQLVHMLGDLFSAGLENIKATLKWAIVYLLQHPLVVTEMRKELDHVVGNQRLPTFADVERLPYCQAVVYETQRIASVVPLGVPHGATENGTVGNFDAPKGAIIVNLLYAIHRNEAYWPNPKLFKPERFLREGKLHVPADFHPFSNGLRKCIGAQVAKKFLFLSIATIVHSYCLQTVPGAVPSTEPVPGFTLHPKRFKMRCIRREQGMNYEFIAATEAERLREEVARKNAEAAAAE